MSLSTKTKLDKSHIDEIDPIEKVVEESEDGTEVISVKLSKGTKDKELKTKEVEEIADVEQIEEVEVEDVDKVEKTKEDTHDSDTATKQVSSFSQLDSDKVAEELEKDIESEDTSQDKPQEEELHSKDHEEKLAEKSPEVLTDDVKKWLEDIHPAGKPDDSGKSGFGMKGIFIILLLLGILGLIIGGFYFYQTSQESASQAPSPVVSTNSPTPSPTPIAEAVDLTKYKVQVLNGTGISGEAGRVAGKLETTGFVDVSAGNASSSAVKETTVQMKEGVSEEVFKAIETGLSDLQVVMADEILAETSAYDVVVTLGTTEKSETVTQ